MIHLDGWTWEEMALARDVGMHLHWPAITPGPMGPRKKQAEARDEQLATLRRAFEDAAAYKIAREAAKDAGDFARDARWEALLPVLDGKLPLIPSGTLTSARSAVRACATSDSSRSSTGTSEITAVRARKA